MIMLVGLGIWGLVAALTRVLPDSEKMREVTTSIALFGVLVFLVGITTIH